MKCAGYLQRAPAVTVLTGAGMSAESGIPTFRGPGGLWKTISPRRSRHSGSFRPGSGASLGVVRLAAQPDRGGTAERRSLRARPAGTARAGIHTGYAKRGWPSPARRKQIGSGGPRQHLEIEVHVVWPRVARFQHVAFPVPPRCECGGRARPGVVWFGENLPRARLERRRACRRSL